MPEYDDIEDFEEGPSKTELKRRSTELQKLGETLCAMSESELAKVPIESQELLTAIAETRRIRSNSARRRHFQLIGKLMRNIDPQPIRDALELMRRQSRADTAAFHSLEALRDDLLSAGLPGIESIVGRFPEADRQHLRQLVLQHQREMKAGKPPAASRKVFRYLRDLSEA